MRNEDEMNKSIHMALRNDGSSVFLTVGVVKEV